MKRLTLAFAFLVLVVSPLFAQWEPDRRLTFNQGESHTDFWNNAWCVASSGDTVHVVWYDSTNGNGSFRIYYKRSTDGGETWEGDTRLTNSDWADEPSVAVSGANVHVVWRDYRGGSAGGEIYYKGSSDGGTTWGQDTRLTFDNSTFGPDHPSVAASGETVHTVWKNYDISAFRCIHYRRSTDGGATWEGEIPLSDYEHSTEYPSVAVSGADVHVVWDDCTATTNPAVYYNRSTDGGTTWEGAVSLADTTGYYYEATPSVAVSGADVHVVWRDWRNYVGLYWMLYYKHSTDGGTSWGGDIPLVTDTTAGMNHGPGWPNVAVSGPKVHVVWIDYRSNIQIYYKRSTDGGTTWEGDTRLSTPDSTQYQCSLYPFIAVSGSRVHVVWEDYRDWGGNGEIYYKRNPTGNSGVVETAVPSPVFRLQFSVRPNPFASFASIPGHEQERFVLYDISGRRIGIYRGDRIGEGLASGVYFLRPEDKSAKPVRIVKLR